MYLSPRKKLFVDTATEMFGAGSVISKQNAREAAEKAGIPFPTWFMKPEFKHCYGSYKLPSEGGSVVASATAPATAAPGHHRRGCRQRPRQGLSRKTSRRTRGARAPPLEPDVYAGRWTACSHSQWIRKISSFGGCTNSTPRLVTSWGFETLKANG